MFLFFVYRGDETVNYSKGLKRDFLNCRAACKGVFFLTSSILEKISALVKSISGSRESHAERAEEMGFPQELSEERKAESLLFAHAVMNGNVIGMEDDSVGVPVGVFMREAEREPPKRYAVWPNKPGERKKTGIRHIKVFPMEAMLPSDSAEGGLDGGRRRLLSIKPSLNDDGVECFYAGLSKKKRPTARGDSDTGKDGKKSAENENDGEKAS
jgi:hypothetical protein